MRSEAFEREIRKSERVARVAKALVDRALAQRVVRLALVKGSRKLLLSRASYGDCEFRVTHFDEHGPMSHRDYRASDRKGWLSIDEEIASAIYGGWRNERRKAR